MKKISTLLLLLVCIIAAQAQQVTFESLPLPASNYWKGVPGVPGVTTFQNNGVTFVNRNDTSSFGDYWSGWGYSATTDTTSVLYSNEMSCIAGKGHNNSNIYGVAYLSFDPQYNKIRFPISIKPVFAYLNNTTIAYRSMQNGDGLAKKFGGATGNDPDFFRIDITGWNGGVPLTDTVRFYLADFRDTNNANDYIIKDWSLVNLSPLGFVDSLTYNLVSSDNSTFGMNTPAYFCMDDITFLFDGLNEVTETTSISIFPNPANDFVIIQNHALKTMQISLLNVNGQMVYQTAIPSNTQQTISFNHLPKGIYMLQGNDGEKMIYQKFTH